MGSKPKGSGVAGSSTREMEGANGANGTNGVVSNPGTGARTGKPRIQSVSLYPIDLIHLGSPAQLRAGHRLGQGTKPLISPSKGFVVVRA